MKQKKLIAACVAAILLAGGMLALYLNTRPDPQAGEKSIRVEVVHADGQGRVYAYTTTLDYLGELLEEQGLVVFEEGPYGMFITEVDGERAVFEENGAYWALYQGEDYAAAGADLTVLEDGAEYALVYTNG